MTIKEPFDRPCLVCGAAPNHGCIIDDEEQPMTGFHMSRSLRTSGPVTVRHTGEFSPDGGAILEIVDDPTEEA